MDATLLKAVIVLVPALLLLSGAWVLFRRARRLSTSLQLAGAVCLVVVALTHICEALHLFPGMHWGEAHSAGHYLDLGCALASVTTFPLGYLLHVLARK